MKWFRLQGHDGRVKRLSWQVVLGPSQGALIRFGLQQVKQVLATLRWSRLQGQQQE